jgi:hypothetical protein
MTILYPFGRYWSGGLIVLAVGCLIYAAGWGMGKVFAWW